MGIKTTQNFMPIWNLLRKMQKILLTKKLLAKEVCKIGVCTSGMNIMLSSMIVMLSGMIILLSGLKTSLLHGTIL